MPIKLQYFLPICAAAKHDPCRFSTGLQFFHIHANDPQPQEHANVGWHLRFERYGLASISSHSRHIAPATSSGSGASGYEQT
jgi:hypothetical protein